MKSSGIYKIQSKIKPERIYIGSAFDVNKRWRSHLWHLRNNKHHCSKLQRHYNKYGKNDLIFSVIIGCDKSNILTVEQFFLDSLVPWFNTCKKAGSTQGRKLSDETKEKLSSLKKGKPTWNKGKHLSVEHKQNIARAQKGENNSFYNKNHSETTKVRMKIKNTGRTKSLEQIEKQRISRNRHYELLKQLKSA